MAPFGNVYQCFFTFSIIVLLTDCIVLKKFEYKFSFKGPHLVQRDGSIPFWEYGGSAIASDESIRITPSLRSKRGNVWSKDPTHFQNWEIEIAFRINGRGRIGADGLAVWFTKDKGGDGTVFGSSDQWNGLGIFMDSFDNDGQHNNPYILAMLNDGTKYYDHATDGRHQQLGGCLRDFRNKPFPVRLKVEYIQNVLTVMIHTGMTSNKDTYELCIRAENVQLPSVGYFGVSAATGGLADDHDVVSFLTHSLIIQKSDTTGQDQGQVTDEERKKFETEFDEYWKKLQEAKEDYKKEHPDATPPPGEIDDEKWFESQDRRELKMIFDGQNSLMIHIQQLQSKLDEIIGKQERTLSQVSGISMGGVNNQANHVQVQDTFKRHEVDTVMAQQRELVQSLREFKGTLNDINSRVNTGQGGGNYDSAKMQEQINIMHQELKTISSRMESNSANCPDVSCASGSLLIGMLLLQIIMLIGYSIYKSHKEASAKKFY